MAALGGIQDGRDGAEDDDDLVSKQAKAGDHDDGQHRQDEGVFDQRLAFAPRVAREKSGEERRKGKSHSGKSVQTRMLHDARQDDNGGKKKRWGQKSREAWERKTLPSLRANR